MLLKWLIRKDQHQLPQKEDPPKSMIDDEKRKSKGEERVNQISEGIQQQLQDDELKASSDMENIEKMQEDEEAPLLVSDGPSEVNGCLIRADQIQLDVPNSRQCIRQLVLLNSVSFPLNYGTNWCAPHYKRVLRNELGTNGIGGDPENEDKDEMKFWTKLARLHNQSNQKPLLVGAITVTCRTVYENEQWKFAIHILTLAVLPSFRRRGVATLLLQNLRQQCDQWPNVEKMFLHCQASNKAALALYRRHGFVEMEYIPDYYKYHKNVAEPDALRLELFINRVTDENYNS